MSATLAPSTPASASVRESPAFPSDSLLLSGTFGLLFLAPLAFGATESWAIMTLEVSTAALFALWVWRQTGSSAPPLRDHPLFKPMALFGLVVAIQLVFGWTAYRRDTFAQALLYLAYGLLVFLVVQAFRKSSQAKVLAVAITVYGIALAGISLLQGWSTIAWIGEALIVVALLDLFLRRFCLGSAVFNLIHRCNTSAAAEGTHPS